MNRDDYTSIWIITIQGMHWSKKREALTGSDDNLSSYI